MSSLNKRSAESEEVSHKKKPRKDDGGACDEDEEDSASEVDDDELQALDSTNIISSSGRRTRGVRVDYTNLKVADTEGLNNDSESETEAKGSNERKRAVTDPRTRSPERKRGTNIEEVKEAEEGGEDEGLGEEDEQDGDPGDEDGDDDDDDDDET